MDVTTRAAFAAAALEPWNELGWVLSSAAAGEISPLEALAVSTRRLGFTSALLASVAGAKDRPGVDSAPTPTVMFNYGYPEEVATYVVSGYVRRCPGYRYAWNSGVASTMSSTPFNFKETITYRDILRPAGYGEGVTLCFPRPRNSAEVALLTMSGIHNRPLDDSARMSLSLLAPVIARIIDAPLPRVIGEADPDAWVLEIARNGTKVWLRRHGARAIPLDEKTLQQFAGHLAVSDGGQAGFHLRDSTGAWWRVQGYRRKEPSAARSVVLVLTARTPPRGLTERELDVLGLLARGSTNAEIAIEIGVSLRTAKTHVESILNKLGKSHRAAAAAIAIEHDLCSYRYRARG